MVCKKCGQVNAEGNRFCSYCGESLQSEPQGPGGYQQPGYQQQTYQQPNYSPNYGYPPNPGFGAPITKRNIAMCIILTLVTCGIYGIYWFYCMVEDLNKVSNDPSPTSGGMAILLTLVTCGIYSLYWYYKAGNQLSTAKRMRTGYPGESNSVLYLVLGLLGLGIVSECLIQNELNQMAV